MILNVMMTEDRHLPGMDIRPARPEDCDTLLGLIRALAEYERLDRLATGTAQELRAELFGAVPVIEAVLAWQDPRAVGFALYFHNFSTFLMRRGLYLEDLYVLPEARGCGIGKALMRHCARLAVERGCGRFEWTVLDWNRPSIEFYESIGAELLPDWRVCRMTGEALQRFALG